MQQDENETLNFSDMLNTTVGDTAPEHHGSSAAEREVAQMLGEEPEKPAAQEAPIQHQPTHHEPVHHSTHEVHATTHHTQAAEQADVFQSVLEEAIEMQYDASPKNYSFLHRARLRSKRILASRPARYIGVAAISLGIFLLVFNLPLIIAGVKYKFTKPTSAPAIETQPATSTPAAEAVPPQPLVIIPKINVNAPIQFPVTLNEADIQTSLRDGVAHYAGTAMPGQNGNIVIFGHSSNDWWQPGNYKFVFALLDRVAVGDTIQVNYNSKKYVYSVVSTKVVVPTDFSVVQPTTEPTLTLITCTPPGTSWKRLVVSAKQIEPAVNQTPSTAVKSPTQIKNLPSDATSSIWTKITSFFNNLF